MFSGLPQWLHGKESTCNAEVAGDPVSIPLDQEDPLQEGMATLSSIPAWRILWTDELAGYSP